MNNKNNQEDLKDFDFKYLEKLILNHSRKIGKPAASFGNQLVKQLTKRTYQALLEAEMQEHLETPKEEPSQKAPTNYRNGYGKKKIKEDFGEVEIDTPRDRNASFEPEIIKKRSSTVGDFTNKIILL